MHYKFSYQNGFSHNIDISYTITGVKEKELQVQLPAWRPGRYELGNFAQYILRVKAKDADGKVLASKKLNKDLWQITTKGSSTVVVEYTFYANEMNAGSTYLDSKQLYVNPVNCCMYVPDRMEEACTVELVLPEDYKVATGMKKVRKHQFKAKDAHDLMDSPFIASATIQTESYEVKGTTFHLWFQGEYRPQWKKLIREFRAFTLAQWKAMKSFPFKEYHFLFQIDTKKAYHGVEHLNSTVIYFGPSYDVIKGNWYDEFIGVSSHELYHAWNIKTIRPVEMMPYDYTKENYSKLGYVAEGVTTYMGDVFLLRCKLYSLECYLKTLDKVLERHFYNFGRHNMSVGDSSFDTWLDGYKPGAPGRKTSIYTEGALCSFMADIKIRKATVNEKSLDDAMLSLYENFGKKGIGYSEQDYQNALEEASGVSFKKFFADYFRGTKDYEPLLKESFDYLGLEIKKHDDTSKTERKLGMRVIDIDDGKERVLAVYPGSQADKMGIEVGDEIVSVNTIKLENNISHWVDYFNADSKVTLGVKNKWNFREVEVPFGRVNYFMRYSLQLQEERTKEQDENLARFSWAKWPAQ